MVIANARDVRIIVQVLVILDLASLDNARVRRRRRRDVVVIL
jgi:hypothetical protein